MGSFKRVLLGYRRLDVDAAIVARDTRIQQLEQELLQIAELEREITGLSGMVVERDRRVDDLREQLEAANQRHERSLAALEAFAGHLEEVHAQARGQATRIRMKALREAVEVSRRVQELTGRIEIDPATLGGDGADANGNGHREFEPAELFEGLVKVEIGPLGDFSQLVRFEDAAERIDATREISVEKFSEGRATLSMRLEEPVALLQELEQRSPLGFRVRQVAADRLILDVEDEQAPEQRAA
jgi:uncharacterized coiled-coil protein SlyX